MDLESSLEELPSATQLELPAARKRSLEGRLLHRLRHQVDGGVDEGVHRGLGKGKGDGALPPRRRGTRHLAPHPQGDPFSRREEPLTYVKLPGRVAPREEKGSAGKGALAVPGRREVASFGIETAVEPTFSRVAAARAQVELAAGGPCRRVLLQKTCRLGYRSAGKGKAELNRVRGKGAEPTLSGELSSQERTAHLRFSPFPGEDRLQSGGADPFPVERYQPG